MFDRWSTKASTWRRKIFPGAISGRLFNVGLIVCVRVISCHFISCHVMSYVFERFSRFSWEELGKRAEDTQLKFGEVGPSKPVNAAVVCRSRQPFEAFKRLNTKIAIEDWSCVLIIQSMLKSRYTSFCGWFHQFSFFPIWRFFSIVKSLFDSKLNREILTVWGNIAEGISITSGPLKPSSPANCSTNVVLPLRRKSVSKGDERWGFYCIAMLSIYSHSISLCTRSLYASYVSWVCVLLLVPMVCMWVSS